MGISDLGNWFKKRVDDAQGVYHQVNMFDGGRTFDTNSRQAMPYTPPPTVRNRNVFQKGFDQINTFDSGRSWQTSLPSSDQSARSGWDQFAPIGKSIVRAPAQMLNTIAAQAPQVLYTGQGMFATNEYGDAVDEYTKAVKLNNPQMIAAARFRMNNASNRVRNINNLQEAANDNFDQNKGGLFNVGTFYNADDARRGDLKTGVVKIGGGTLQTAATVVPFARGGSVVMGSQPLSKAMLLRLAKEGAVYGAGYSTGNQLQETGRVDPKTLARDTALGVAGNVILPVAGRGMKNGVTIGIQKGGQALDNLQPMANNQAGFIKLPGRGEGPKISTKVLDEMRQRNAGSNAYHERVDAMNKAMLAADGAPELQAPKNLSKGGVTESLDYQALRNKLMVAKSEAAPGIVKPVYADGPVPKGVKVSGGKQPPAPIVPDLQPAAAPAPGQKMSRFANKTVQASDEVSDPLKVMVKEQQVTYNPHTNKDRLAAADRFLQKKSNNSAYTHVVKTFEKAGNPTDQDIVTAIQAAKRMDASGKEADLFRATEIYDTLSRKLTESGQQIQAASLLNNRTPQGLMYGAQKSLRKAGVELTPEIQKNIKTLVDAVKKQKPGTYEDGLARYKVMEYVEKLAPAGIADKGVQVWKAGLLSAPTTTGGNLAANTAEGVYRKLYQDPVATAADMVMSLITGKRSKSYTGRGLFEGTKEGVGKGVKYFKTGYDPRNPLEKFDVHSIHFSDKPAGKLAEKYTQSIFRLMGSQDQPYYYAALRNSLADQAVTAAKNSGLKGAQRDAFIQKFITEPAKDAMQLADDEARYAVFQNKTAIGNVASKVNKGPVGQFLIPFSQVPSSIATRMIERSPLGLGKEIIKQIKNGKFDQRAMSRAVADTTAGLVFIGAGANLAKEGLLTTSFPTDPKERDLWELEGKQPNSVKIGNTWVSLNYFQPMGALFAAGANYQKAKDDGKDPAAAFSSSLAGASKAFTEQSFLKGVSGGLQALSDPQRSAEKFAENTAGSVVPNIIRSTARSFDDVNREQDGLGESVIAGIPGLRQTLPERTDMFGDAVPRKTSAINSFLNPLRPSDVRPSTELNGELRRLLDADEGVTATKIMKDALGEGVELNRDQQLEVKNAIGQQIKSAWAQTVQDGRYQSLADGDKRRVLEKIKDDIGAVIKQQYGQAKGLKVADPSKLSTTQTLLANQQGGMVDYLSGAGDQTTRDNFANSGQKYQVIGDNIYYKAANGDVVVKPKALYEYEQQDAQLALNLDRARAGENLGAWMKLAEQKVQLLENKKKFYDPVFEADEIARITLQQENLMDQAERYAGYGGFKKGRGGGRGGSGVNLPSINVGVSSDLMGPVVSNSSYQAPKMQLRSKGRVRVAARKRGGVRIKAPRIRA